MSQRPSLAIVIPVFNEASMLQNIQLDWQQLGADEYIYCDGGSDDKTQQILAEKSLPYMLSKAGRAIQMNAGAKVCKSDILLFIHADTSLTASDMEAVKTLMLDVDVMGGRFDVRLSGKHSMFRVIEFMINFRSRITGISTGDQCQFVRRSVFEAMGGFPQQALMEDVEFSKRLKQYGKIVCLKNKVTTSSRRWEKYGIGKTILLMWKLRFLYFLGVPAEKIASIYRNVR